VTEAVGKKKRHEDEKEREEGRKIDLHSRLVPGIGRDKKIGER